MSAKRKQADTSAPAADGRKRKQRGKKNGRIAYVPWNQKPVYERAANLETSSFTQYRIKDEVLDEAEYAGKHVRFFPLKFTHHTARRGEGVDTVVTGVLENDTTACVRLKNFHPHVFVAIPPTWLDLAKREHIGVEDVARTVFYAFRSALKKHVDANPNLFEKYSKLEGKLTFDLFDQSEWNTTQGMRYRETKPWMVGKDCFGYNHDETQTMLRIDFTDNQLCRVAMDMWTNPMGVSTVRCALCNELPRADESMLGHHGSCSARYHRECLTKWFVAERVRGTYDPGKRVHVMRVQDTIDEESDGQCDDDDAALLMDLLIDDVEVWVPNKDDTSSDEDMAAESRNGDSVHQMRLDDYWSRNKPNTDAEYEYGASADGRCESDDENDNDANGQDYDCEEADGVLKHVGDCSVDELARGVVPKEWLEHNEEIALGSCMCCRSSIYRVVDMSPAAMKRRDELDAANDKVWKSRRVRLANWWESDLYPALHDLGLHDAQPPEPVDLFGEEELFAARQTDTILPKPRATVYDGAVDQRYQLFTETGLHPAVWWKLDRRSIEFIDPTSNKRVSTCPVELAVDYRDVQNLDDAIAATKELDADDTTGLCNTIDARRDVVVSTKRAAVVELCFDLEVRPKTARYKDKHGVYHDSLHGTGFPTPDDDPILNIGAMLHNHGDGSEKFFVFALKHISRTEPGMKEFCAQTEILEFSDERTMLNAFVQFVAVLRPSVISHYNGNSFDLPYLVQRCQKLGVRNGEYLGSHICGKGVFWKTSLTRGKVTTNFMLPGALVLDYLYYEQQNNMGQRSYTLNAIAEQKLGERKLDMPYSLIPEYQQTAEKRAVLARYVLKDAHLTLRIGLKSNALSRLYGFSKLSHATPELLMMRKTQYRIGAFLHYKFYNYGLACYGMPLMLPTLVRKDKPTGRDKGYEGAIVFPPKRGMYSAVYPQMYGRVNRKVPEATLRSVLQTTEENSGAVEEWIRVFKTDQRVPATRGAVPDPSEPLVTRFELVDKQSAKRSATDGSPDASTTTDTNESVYGRPGIIATLDYASLYPATMESQNLCLSTFLTKARMHRYRMALSKYPFIHPDDVIYGSNRDYEVLVSKDGEQTTWADMDVPIRAQLQEAVEAGELRDNATDIQHPELRDLYYKTMAVWSRPVYEFDNEANTIYLKASPETPMFVTDRVRRGMIPDEQVALRAYRQSIRSQAKGLAKEIKRIRAGFADLATDAERVAATQRIKDLQFQVEQIDALQLAVKYIMNSIYGFFGAPESILPCKPMAETITLTGQYFVMSAAMVARRHGNKANGYSGSFEVVYGDTDSVFIYMLMDDPFGNTKVYMMSVTQFVCSLVNRGYPWAKIMSLEFEKIFLWILLIAPKNYIGLKLEETGMLSKVTKGVRNQRRDSFALQGHAVNKCIDLTQMNLGVRAIDYVGGLLEDVFENRIPLQLLAQSTSFSKALDDPTLRENSATVVARKRFAYNGQVTEPGDRFLIVYRKPKVEHVQSEKTKKWSVQTTVKGVHRAEDLAHALQEPKFEYDAEHYAAAVVQASLNLLLALVPQPEGIPFDALRSLEWLMNRWENRPYFQRYERKKRLHNSLINRNSALTRGWDRCIQCCICSRVIRQTAGLHYASPAKDFAHRLERLQCSSKRGTSVDVDKHRDAQERVALLKRELICKTVTPVTQQGAGMHLDDDTDNDLRRSTSLWDTELSNSLSLINDDSHSAIATAESMLLEELHDDRAQSLSEASGMLSLDMDDYEFAPADVRVDEDTGAVIIHHYMQRQHTKHTAEAFPDRAHESSDQLPLSVQDAKKQFDYRMRHTRSKVSPDRDWKAPHANPVPPICPECIRTATLEDPASAVLWKRAFNACEFNDRYYDTCVRSAAVLHVTSRKNTDRWHVLFVLTPFGVRRQRNHAMVATVATTRTDHTSASDRMTKAIAENVGNWAVCSMCATANKRSGDVASCATIECDNNGMRMFSKSSAKRYVRERATLAW